MKHVYKVICKLVGSKGIAVDSCL